MEIIIKTILVGVGATIVMDIWAFILKLFNIKSLDYRFVGRWIGHFANGKFTHDKIFDSKPIQNEIFIGWLAHYLIGITFSILLVVIFGVEWLNHPTVFPALFVGLFTIVAPFFATSIWARTCIFQTSIAKCNAFSQFTHTFYFRFWLIHFCINSFSILNIFQKSL